MTPKIDLGASWGVLEASWGVLGASWPRLGPSWARLGASWARLVASCCVLVASWARLGASWSVKPPQEKPGLAMHGKRVFIHLRWHFSDICCFFFSTLANCKEYWHESTALRSARFARSLRLYNGYLFYSCAVATCKNVKFFSVLLQFF